MKKWLMVWVLMVYLCAACTPTASFQDQNRAETKEGGAQNYGNRETEAPERKSSPTQMAAVHEQGTLEGTSNPATQEVNREAKSEPTESGEGDRENVRNENDGSAIPKTETPKFSQPWMSMPVVPEVSDTAREIYQRGLEKGNNPHKFSKIGDCQNINTFFLSTFENEDSYDLGEEYAHLQSVIDHFQGSFGRESLAVEGGFNVAAVLSPLRANQKECGSGVSPLVCELRKNRPSFVIISFEEWWGDKSADTYEKYMRQIVETTIAYDVVPILATKADNLEGDHSINQAIVKIAEEYDIPLWNFWRAAHRLPGNGLKEDGFHLTYKRHCNDFDNQECLKYAWTWRNLTSLQSIHAVWEGVRTQSNGE